VKILLGRDEANPDKLANRVRALLSIVASYGHNRMISLLQPLKAVGPDPI